MYCANTAYTHRWEQIFQHEYISLIWLTVHGYNTHTNTPSTNAAAPYFPKRVLSRNPEFCNCGSHKEVSDDFCRFCASELRKRIKESIQKCDSIF